MRKTNTGFSFAALRQFTGAGTRHLMSVLLVIAFFSVPTGLSAQTTGTITGIITDAKTKSPLPGANVAILGTQMGTTTRPDGSFRLKVNPGTYELQVSYIGYNRLRESITVGAGETVTRNLALAENLIGVGEVVVTGTRRADRTVVESPVPIDVLTATEIRQTGLTETSQLIQMVVPSFNLPRPSIADGSDHIRPVTLRGLGPDQVLVLVNGKRRHNTALVHVNGTIGRGSTSVDLNAIPASTIERIEVLRDGAAAQYGSDAIAGVINIILKSDQQASLASTAGQTSESDGEVIQAEGNYGFQLSESGFLHFSGEYRDRGLTNRSRPDTRQQYFTGDPRNNNPPVINHRQGDAETQDALIFMNGALPLSEKVTLYSFGGFSRRQGEATGFFRRANDDRTVRALHPDGFLPEIHSKVYDGSLAAGLKGTLSGWVWDLSSVYGRNSFRFDVKNSNNVSLGPVSPLEFYAGTLVFQQNSSTLDFSRQLNIGLNAPLNLAIGAEFRYENYQIEAGEEASYNDGGVPVLDGPNAGALAAVGAQVFPGFRPTDATSESRSNFGVYVDAENNLTSSFTVSAAGRFENYSDFGSTTIGKLALRFEPVRKFAVRGAVSSGFRAPTLGQSFFSSTATNFINGVPFEVKTFPVESPQAEVLGAEPLKAEKSVNLSAGFTMEPIDNLSFTADFYRITIDDRIVFSENFTGPSIAELLRPFGASGGRFFTNAIDTKTQGVDVIARYGFQIGRSTLRLTGAFNRNDTEVTRVAPTPPQLQGFEETLFGRVERGRIEEGQPQDNINFVANFSLGAFGVMARTIRFGQVTIRNVNPVQDQTFSAKWITELDLSYGFWGQLTVAVGASNLFDVYPDENIPANSTNGILVYNGTSPFGFNGRYYYGRLAYRL
ncbi:MAG: TonB-dependent receptor [bacterium]